MSIESVLPSNHLILCHPLLLLPAIFPSITIFSSELALLIRWPEYLELFFHSSPVSYWIPFDLGRGGPSSDALSFCLFILFMRFSWQECWSRLPFSLPMNHVLSELSIMTHPPWIALQGMAHPFIELFKRLHHDRSMIHEGAAQTQHDKIPPCSLRVLETLGPKSRCHQGWCWSRPLFLLTSPCPPRSSLCAGRKGALCCVFLLLQGH